MKFSFLQKTQIGAGLGILLLLAACGARTGLELNERSDASADSATDASMEADVVQEPDAKADVTVDVAEDTPLDTPWDTVVKTDCTDPTITYVYVVTESGKLYSFRPQSMAFAYIGPLNCITDGIPFSMAVDRKGTAHIVSSMGSLYRAKIADASCQLTKWQAGTSGFSSFGMGYSTDQGGPTEKLYIAASALNSNGDVPKLGWLDTTTYKVTQVGLVDDGGMELTGTGDNRLFGFFQGSGTDARLVQLNKSTAEYESNVALPGVAVGAGWAFAFWGGDFWFFTANGASSSVTRYQPSTKHISVVANLSGEIIVGAGVSTCAPEK